MMKNLFKSAISRICHSIILLSSIGFVQAQSQPDWTIQSEKNGVKLYSATTLCGAKNMLVLKLENATASAKHVNYNVIVKGVGRNIPLLPQSLKMGPSETKTGSCDAEELISELGDITSYDLKVILVVN